MRKMFFWLITSTILAVFCHIGYLLFVPSRSFNAAIDVALTDTPDGNFTVLSPEMQTRLFPFSTTDHIVGMCKFNVANGAVKVAASLPEGFWSFAVYTIRGQQVYAINDTQADTNTFSVELTKDKGFLASIFSGGADSVDVAGDDLGWRISIADNQGIAVLWMAVGDSLLRAEAEAVISKSRCVRVDG